MSKIKWDVPESVNKKDGDIPYMTLMVDLPSKGLYYPKDLFIHEMEQCEIKYVTGKEEAILINKDYARNGITIDKFIYSLFIDDKMRFPQVYNSLMLADITALAIAGRNSAYGSDYSVEIKCPSCGEEQKSVYDLSAPKHNCGYVDNVDELDGKVEWLGEDKFKVLETPYKKYEVVFRLLNHKDELNMRKALRAKREFGFKEQYLPLIISVNGESGPNVAAEFLDNAPAYDLKYIRNIINLCTPLVELKQEFNCSNCGFTKPEFDLPITENFFIPR